MAPRDDQSPVPDITDEEMRRTVVMVRRELSDIKTALIGNDLGTPGVVPRLAKVEEQTSNHARVLAIVSGALVLISVSIVFLRDLRDILAK